ncbi:MAG: sugar nucleotide-binding protein [Pseudomonadota bacterium]|nr:sugar nucleotide-binding protein [Pseudomonadota bacterium]
MKAENILFTGGSGLLGGEVKQLLPQAYYPSSTEFNVTNFHQMQAYLQDKTIELLIHAAAFTSPPMVDKTPQQGIDANIIGTAHVVKLCMTHQIKLFYISTDYVFKGDKGLYQEADPVYPVNKYAWSKLGGECAVRMYDNSLIIRTSFGPNVFPFPKAFVDQLTSREPVRSIAQKLVALIDQPITGTIHVGGPRRSVYEYAKSLDPNQEIGKLSTQEVSFKVPQDTSLACDYYHTLVSSKE